MFASSLKGLCTILSVALLGVACSPAASSIAPGTADLLGTAKESLAGPASGTDGTQTAGQAPQLRGHVSFGPGRSTQAAMSEVLDGATVSLISAGTDRTVSSAVTDGTGNFVMTFSGAFLPESTETYYLEAFKGLGGNKPSNGAVRVRTLVRFTTGWVSIVNATPNQSITVNSATTALALAAALRNQNPDPFDFASLVGKLDVSGGNVYTTVPGVSQADYAAVLALADQALAKSLDPMADIGLSGTTWVSLGATAAVAAPKITGIVPNSGTVGTAVTVSGTSFSPALTSNVLRFGGAQATLGGGSTTGLQTTVPPGATSGQTTLQVGGITVLGPLFTVTPVLSGMSPSSGTPGTSVTLTGSGFDAAIAAGAFTGKVAISVAGATAQSAGNFVVPVTIGSLTPTQAAAGMPVAITGSGFASTAGGNTVTLGGVAATVISATPTTLVVSAPTVSSPGPAVVSVSGQSATSAIVFSNPPGGASAAKITTLAGAPYLGGVMPSTAWGVYRPVAATLDAAGNLYLGTQEYRHNGQSYGDNNTYSVLRISADGFISRVAGGNSGGNSGDGGPATKAQFYYPNGVAVDGAGNVYISDNNYNRVRKVSAADGTISAFAGTGSAGFSGDGGAASAAKLNSPNGLAIDAAGNVYIADSGNHRIRKVSAAGGTISTFAGNGSAGYTASEDGGAATAAKLYSPTGLAFDQAGNAYIADYNNHKIRKVKSADGKISTFAGISAYSYGFEGDNGPATTAKFRNPWGVSVDAAGNVYISDRSNYRVRKVDTAGVITTIAGTGTNGFSGDGGSAISAKVSDVTAVVVNSNGSRIYLTDFANNRVRLVSGGIITSITADYDTRVPHWRGDGGQAQYAGLNLPMGVAVDAAGNTLVADTWNHAIRKVATSGIITTIAGNGPEGFSGDNGAATGAALRYPNGVAIDTAGNVFIADTNNHRIRKIDAATGKISTIAGNGGGFFGGDGGPATSASLYYPTNVALDPNTGDLYIADRNNHRIRMVEASSGKIWTVAGTSSGFSGDGSIASSAQMRYPSGVAFVLPNVVYVADTDNNRIRRFTMNGHFGEIMTSYAGNDAYYPLVDFTAGIRGTLYHPWGVTADAQGIVYASDLDNNRIRKIGLDGNISTVAGSGDRDFRGDDANPVNAAFNGPRNVAIHPTLGLVVADMYNHRIRVIK